MGGNWFMIWFRGNVLETKIQRPYEELFGKLWFRDRVIGKAVKAKGRAGGIISMWQVSFFQLEESIDHKNFLLLIGIVKGTNEICGFDNIYAPNDEGEMNRV
ncbi:uncharacterized protein LOC110409782 [Herrania umbratica]|uniref:Uncharacterized protein LOC110409782 n=1 Tax=Herrania umbratica TaxID=108875 RepID=A0A6J0ZJA5_9ROSI|nr:uncharacterized protein LOC110409782 [Herrania umbratica]